MNHDDDEEMRRDQSEMRELSLTLSLVLALTFALGLAGPPLGIALHAALRLYYSGKKRRPETRGSKGAGGGNIER